MKKFGHGCTLDCWDCCKFDVYVKENKIVDIKGDPSHPYTKGFICIKGKKHLDRLSHKDRILSPMKKIDGEFVEISFEEALDEISKKLLKYKEEYGSTSVLNYKESGSGGILKSIDDVFFNFYGGVTKSTGSTCWGAGKKAQKYDFGESRSNYINDALNSKSIILWGRNPANTSIHLFDILKKSQKNGTKIITIDPVYTNTAKISDIYIRPNPSSDGALAILIAKYIVENNELDQKYIDENIVGFEEYKKYLNKIKQEYLLEETGISIEEVRLLSNSLLEGKCSIYPGYGLQKYSNGGNTIRAIDALSAITKNIGIEGGGVNYANKVYTDVLDLDPFDSIKRVNEERYFEVSEFISFIKDINIDSKKPIKAIFISKANPLNQFPNLNETISAFKSIEFKVCIDMFMTDTARECDIFIPCTNTLESEDLVYSSMNNPFLIYNEKIVSPKDILMDEYEFFRALANKMNLNDYPDKTKHEYLQMIIKPLEKMKIHFDDIKNGYINIQDSQIAFKDLKFKTPSQKIEIYSNRALEDGYSPIPIYIKGEKDDRYPLRLITNHPKNSLFSQHFIDEDSIAKGFISTQNMIKYKLNSGQEVKIASRYGQINIKIYEDVNCKDDIIHMNVGWNKIHGNPNFLTKNSSSEMGGQVAYYDTFVDIIE